MHRRQFIKGSAILGFSAVQIPLITQASAMFTEKGNRTIRQILSASGVNVGTLPVMRAFAGDHVDYVSPYVLFDEFGPVQVEAGSDPLRVDAHPHAGVTPTTYFLHGTGHHKDSLNYDFQIGKGDFMLFSSGRGAIHMEESGQKLYDDGGMYHGFQIWLNTPAAYKFDAPSTTVYRQDDMSVIKGRKYEVQVVLGEWGKKVSSIELKSPAFYYHVKADAEARIDVPVEYTDNAFIYMISGKLELESQKELSKHQLALYERNGSNINLFAMEKSEFLILGGKPLDEEVFSYGPFVMNNEDQIRQCIRNYQSGLMGNPDVVNK